jgi:2-polyprenyl-6-methoxyphenol hydroxylase-like FAD-dependent oxidoreductase
LIEKSFPSIYDVKIPTCLKIEGSCTCERAAPVTNFDKRVFKKGQVMTTKTDVLVAGAGPVGLMMAAELARYGVSVRIVEKNPQRTDKSKAIIVWSRTLELMDRMGCSQDFLSTGLKVTGVKISAGREQIAHITFDSAATAYPFGLMVPQNETERLLDEHLNSFGVKVERTVELMQFTQQKDKVTSTLHHADGSEETLETTWLVGCDGAHSIVRHELGMEFTGSTQTSDWMLADLHINGTLAPVDTMNAFWHSDGVLIIFPIVPGRYRVIADLGLTDPNKPRPDPTLEEVQAVLDERGPGGMQVSDPIWLATFHINERKVAQYQSGRVFMAGDAAHIHSPAGGQGMNTGMQDACNLAWKLASVVHGTCAENPVLESYSPERSAIGDQILKAAGKFTDMAVMQGEVKQSIRNHIASFALSLAPVRKFAVNVLEEISIRYPNSPLNAQDTHGDLRPAIGERAPIREGEMPVGAGDRPRFVLFGNADDTFLQLVAQYPNLLEPTLRKPYRDGGLWLVRPDGYVALTTEAGDWNAVTAYLDRIGRKQSAQAVK